MNYKGQRTQALKDTDCFTVSELYRKCGFSGVYGMTTVHRFLNATDGSEPMRNESEENINKIIQQVVREETK